ncbi:aldo/keto reductase [Glutamicibacter protophormiae]|jgi:2,5-diketo-D-gluconate reductase A|uniref:2,5-diketo-D-gluconate reductase A n=1 Tax=Glutamicibacter protophormiae TaxID=37930 RepID=A0ABS4XPI6_GLUPR|nr:aldo/keto reductase [Glutamicibacter protophormiae]MBP2398421.1 2,5-diketo-D-gluconate reductase A [Glutamicibacter protophormiae]QRQ79198.1 aldo/keto reductase [Glutamicibacter protophormiae]WPR65274.1 aldo/keto reductase [Glutamicibacter protophormiae]WPR68771.1 aldo/keto reductase [Glutamicibacter protophormiae]GGL98501.1 oxidoreductase [Glutamicibacter protophormiae]
MTQTVPELTFHDGNTIDQLGYGVWQVPDAEAEIVVGKAIDAGYRHIDTAKIYGNEEGVGRAIASAGIPREELFITTKVWNADQGYENTLAAADASLQRLGLDYVDLYLIHWLQPKRGTYVDTWKALIQLQKDGKAKSIGVCNFTVEALEELYAETGVRPVINQVETHPYFPQSELRAYEAQHGILHESWSPLGQGGDLLTDPVLVKIAEKHSASVAQVVIAWHLALGNVVIPKSVTESRIIENFASLELTLDDEDLAEINSLDRGAEGRIAADPATADFA